MAVDAVLINAFDMINTQLHELSISIKSMKSHLIYEERKKNNINPELFGWRLRSLIFYHEETHYGKYPCMILDINLLTDDLIEILKRNTNDALLIEKNIAQSDIDQFKVSSVQNEDDYDENHMRCQSAILFVLLSNYLQNSQSLIRLVYLNHDTILLESIKTDGQNTHIGLYIEEFLDPILAFYKHIIRKEFADSITSYASYNAMFDNIMLLILEKQYYKARQLLQENYYNNDDCGCICQYQQEHLYFKPYKFDFVRVNQ